MRASSCAWIVVVLGAVAAAAATARVDANILSTLYRRIPAGFVPAHCVHNVPSGAAIEETDDAAFPYKWTHPKTLAIGRVPRCVLYHPTTGERLPNLVTNEELVARNGSNPLPPDYNGWLAYTAYNNSVGFDRFQGKFTIPHNPPQMPHILYLFIGLQNKDWVPKVDPLPESAGFDIIQPVLQYPADTGVGWSVKSWYVTLDAGAVASDEVICNSGNQIIGDISRTGPESWYIGSTCNSTGETTSVNMTATRLRTQPWAYNVLEAYGVTGCQNYPDNACVFTDLALYIGSTKVATPAWVVNPKPNPDPECKEKIVVNSPSQMTITFQ